MFNLKISWCFTVQGLRGLFCAQDGLVHKAKNSVVLEEPMRWPLILKTFVRVHIFHMRCTVQLGHFVC